MMKCVKVLRAENARLKKMHPEERIKAESLYKSGLDSRFGVNRVGNSTQIEYLSEKHI